MVSRPTLTVVRGVSARTTPAWIALNQEAAWVSIRTGASCSCTQFEPLDDISPLDRVKIIRAQILALRNILAEAQRRGLAPEEDAAFRKIAEAFAELSQTWREVFGE